MLVLTIQNNQLRVCSHSSRELLEVLKRLHCQLLPIILATEVSVFIEKDSGKL